MNQLVPGAVNERSLPFRYFDSICTWVGSCSGAGP